MELNAITQCSIALLLGAAIGLERDSYENRTDKTEKSGMVIWGLDRIHLLPCLEPSRLW